jgi:hypothetical protein
MTGPAYPAAQIVAPRVHEHFVRHTAEAVKRGERNLATVPDAHTIEAMIDAAFWASLRREETYIPKISLAYLSPAQTTFPLMFERPLALEPAALVRLAPAVERAGIHLAVWPDGDGLSVWGTTRAIPTFCIVIEVAAPGLLVIKHHRGAEGSKYVNVAVLEGDQIKVVDEKASSLPDCPSLLTSLIGFDSPESWLDSVNLLVQLAVSMRTHGRGGLLLAVPSGSDAWLESIVRPIPYAVVPAFTELSQLSRETADGRRQRGWQDAVARSIEAIAGLTAVVGGTDISNERQSLGVGAEQLRRQR